MRAIKEMPRVAVAIGSAGAIALSAWLMLRSGPSEPAGAMPAAAPAATGAPSSVPALREAASSDGPLLLRVRVLGARGEQIPAAVFYSCSPERPVCASLLAPELGYALPGAAQSEQAPEGTAVLALPERHWTWLRVLATGGIVASSYRLVPPGSGERTLEVRLDAAARVIHVFALAADLLTAAEGAEIRLLAGDITQQAPPRELRRVRTDATGYVRFEGLGPGSFWVLAPGTTPADPGPRVQRVMLPAQSSLTEFPCTVVLAARSTPVQATVAVESGLDSTGVAHKLVLRRKDDGSGRVYAFSGWLHPGEQLLSVAVPGGTYEVDTLPAGDYEPWEPDRIVHLTGPEPQSARIRLRVNRTSTDLQLTGIAAQVYPVNVYFRGSGAAWDDEPGLSQSGPGRWHDGHMRVRLPRQAGRLVALGRGATYISALEVIPAAGAMHVEMIPATRIDLTVRSGLAAQNASIVEIATSEGPVLRYLDRRLVMRDGALVAADVASVVVPHGDYTLTLHPGSATAGSSRVVRAVGPVLAVDWP